MPQFPSFAGGGFFARGHLPTKENPGDWLAWHFTHESNILDILRKGALLPSTAVQPRTNVGQLSIKRGRTSREIELRGYPYSFVADHVPLYFAARSPMLFKVCHGHDDYRGGAAPLVFLGFQVSDIVSSGGTWCASEANAATAWAQFTWDLRTLGSFVDFDLLTQKYWNNTLDDPNRQSRRAAELLVKDRLPIELVTLVVTQNQTIRDEMEHMFDRMGLRPAFMTMPDLYY